MATSALTIGERILVHLYQYRRHQDAFVCPTGMSQGGIANTLGISRAHAAIELRRQMEAGRVAVRIAHVTGMPTRRKVYALTLRGVGVAHSLRGRALAVTRELFLPNGRVETMEGTRALRVLRQHGIPEARAVLLLLTLEQIDVQTAARVQAQSQRSGRSHPEERAAEAFWRAFVAPVEWQFEVLLGPPRVPPLPVAA